MPVRIQEGEINKCSFLRQSANRSYEDGIQRLNLIDGTGLSRRKTSSSARIGCTNPHCSIQIWAKVVAGEKITIQEEVHLGRPKPVTGYNSSLSRIKHYVNHKRCSAGYLQMSKRVRKRLEQLKRRR